MVEPGSRNPFLSGKTGIDEKDPYQILYGEGIRRSFDIGSHDR